MCYDIIIIIGQQVNQFLNDNWEEAENELRSGIAPAIGEIISSIVRQYLTKFSMTDMFLPWKLPTTILCTIYI